MWVDTVVDIGPDLADVTASRTEAPDVMRMGVLISGVETSCRIGPVGNGKFALRTTTMSDGSSVANADERFTVTSGVPDGTTASTIRTLPLT